MNPYKLATLTNGVRVQFLEFFSEFRGRRIRYIRGMVLGHDRDLLAETFEMPEASSPGFDMKVEAMILRNFEEAFGALRVPISDVHHDWRSKAP